MARAILRKHLDSYRKRSVSELASLVDSPATAEVVAVSGERYQIEVQVFWADSEKRTLRVLGSIDDGGWRTLLPLCEDFLVDSQEQRA